jgi:hypothetical protein
MPNARVPANAVALPSLSRRSLLAGIAAASTAGMRAAAAQTSTPDAKLCALQRTFEEAVAAHKIAQRRYCDCETRYFALKPKPPEELTIDGPLGRLLANQWDVVRTITLRHLLNDSEQSALWDVARAALPLARAHEAKLRAARRKTGVPAAEAANNAAVDRVHEVMEAVLAAPARSLAGLAVKARVLKAWGCPDWWSEDADTCDSLAAQIVEAVIAADARSA